MTGLISPSPQLSIEFVDMQDDHLEARSLTLRDSKGNPRITLDAGDDSGYAVINIVSNTGNKLTISSLPNGAVVMSFDQKETFVGVVTLSALGLTLRDDDGKLGITLGKHFDDGDARLTVSRNGQVVWAEPPTC